MRDDTAIRRSPGVLHRTLEGRHVLYHPDDDAARVLDTIGSLVWDLLADAPTHDQLVGDLAARFGEPAERIRLDLEPLLADLAAANLIRVG